MKRVYDIVDILNMAPAEVPRDLKLEVEFVDRGVWLRIHDLQGTLISEGGIDIPTLIGFARSSQLQNNSRP